MGDIALPPNLNKPVVQYLQELRDKLIAANEFAATHLQREQSNWVKHYNLKASSGQKQIMQKKKLNRTNVDSAIQ